MTTAKLLLHCPDKPGILAEVTDFITVNKGNIIYLDQYVDHVENIFFMRIEWKIGNGEWKMYAMVSLALRAIHLVSRLRRLNRMCSSRVSDTA